VSVLSALRTSAWALRSIRTESATPRAEVPSACRPESRHRRSDKASNSNRLELSRQRLILRRHS